MFVLVIGAGIIGAAVADAMARRGARVTVLDMRPPGHGASRASAGILAPYTEAHPDAPLLPLGVRSLDLYDDFVAGARERSGRAIEYARTGTLEVALDAHRAGELRASFRQLVTAGVAAEWFDGAAVRAIEPALAPEAVAALAISRHGHVGVESLVAALVQSARFAGATFESPVEAIDLTPEVDGIRVGAGDRRYIADAVVVASGSWAQRLRLPGRTPMPVRPVRGQLLHLRWPDDGPPRQVVWGPHCYAVPWADGSLLVGATVEDAGFDERPTVEGVRALTGAVAELLPAARRASVDAIRVGLRPAMPDGLPAVGPLSADPRIVAATGHYRNGILLAPWTAEVVSRYLIDGVRDASLEITRPDRFRA